jgi:transcriptional regulator with XRE-family HTH domain
MADEHLAENIRRLSGMHLVSNEELAEYLGVSRQAVQAIVSPDPAKRSKPSLDTYLKLADAFGIDPNTLRQEPVECLREAVEHFEEAPIRSVVGRFARGVRAQRDAIVNHESRRPRKRRRKSSETAE